MTRQERIDLALKTAINLGVNKEDMDCIADYADAVYGTPVDDMYISHIYLS